MTLRRTKRNLIIRAIIITCIACVFLFHTWFINKENESIPKHIHFIWISPYLNLNTVPQVVSDNLEHWKQMNPDFEVTLWTDFKIKRHFPKLTELLHKIKVPAWIGDILRYRIVYEYGGIYLDTDIVPLKPFSKLLEKYENGFVGCEEPKSESLLHRNCTYVCNAVFAAKKGSSWLKAVAIEAEVKARKYIESTNKTVFTRGAFNLTGPPLLTRHVLNNSGVNILPSDVFYPCLWYEKKKCRKETFAKKSDVFAKHLWADSWFDS